jgi:acyl dehydratase
VNEGTGAAAGRIAAVGIAVGDELDRVTFDVEPGKIREFARATRARDAVHLDARAAAEAGFAGPAATATHVVVAGHQRDQGAVVARLGLALERVVVGEVSWQYRRPLIAGDRARGIRRVVADEVKARPDGRGLRLVTLRTDYVDEAGLTVVRQREVLVERPAPAVTTPAAGPPTPGPTTPRTPMAVSEGSDVPDGSDDEAEPGMRGDSWTRPTQVVQIGDRLPVVEIGPISQTDIVRFAGAGGDFNPLHHDPDFARQAGFERVIAMGQFQAGMLAAWLTDWCGIEHLLEFGVRFTSPLAVGDTVEFDGTVTEHGEQRAGLELLARCGDRTVIRGTATIRTAGRAPQVIS